MVTVAPTKKPLTTDALRADIDRGMAGDKVGYPDPAAVPLGTDAEAGGIPPTGEEIRLATENVPLTDRTTSTTRDGVGFYVVVVLALAAVLAIFAVVDFR